MDDTTFVNAGILESEIEAHLLASILLERDIAHRIRSYHDTAYDGLFQAQKGWGVVLAPEHLCKEVAGILEEIRSTGFPAEALEQVALEDEGP